MDTDRICNSHHEIQIVDTPISTEKHSHKKVVGGLSKSNQTVVISDVRANNCTLSREFSRTAANFPQKPRHGDFRVLTQSQTPSLQPASCQDLTKSLPSASKVSVTRHLPVMRSKWDFRQRATTPHPRLDHGNCRDRRPPIENSARICVDSVPGETMQTTF